MNVITTQSETFHSPGGLQTLESYTPYMICSPALEIVCEQEGIAPCYAEIAKTHQGGWGLVRGPQWVGQSQAVIAKAQELGYL